MRSGINKVIKNRLLGTMAGVLGIVMAGCGQRESTSAGAPAQAAGAAATTPVMESVITTWLEGSQPEAIAKFLEVDWDAVQPLFGADSLLSFSEEQFQSRIKSLRSSEAEQKRSEMMAQIDSLKQLAAKVAKAGKEAASKGDAAGARKHFATLRQCGEALDRTNSLAILRLVGQGIKKRASTEMSKLEP